MLANDKEKAKSHGILVDIDCLFDTRLAVLESMDDILTEEILLNGYFTRERDDFDGIDLHEFRKRYKERNLNTLQHSKPTTLLVNLRDTVARYIYNSTREGKINRTELILNIYPYQLNKEEINDFVLCLKYYTDNMVPVRVINSPYTDITPGFLDENVVGFFTYDWYDWLLYHWVPLSKHRLDSVVMMVPKVFPLSRKEAADQIRQIEQESKDLLLPSDGIDELLEEMGSKEVLMEKLFSLLIGFTFVDTREFCIVLPDDFVLPTPENK